MVGTDVLTVGRYVTADSWSVLTADSWSVLTADSWSVLTADSWSVLTADPKPKDSLRRYSFQGNIMQGELWGLGLEEFTIGEMFQEYGYKTHAIGMQNIPKILKPAHTWHILI